MTTLVPLQYPKGNGGGTAVEFAIDPAKFHDAFAADLPLEQTDVIRSMAARAGERSPRPRGRT